MFVLLCGIVNASATFPSPGIRAAGRGCEFSRQEHARYLPTRSRWDSRGCVCRQEGRPTWRKRRPKSPAEDGWEAWEILSERRFDAVVTALEMPRLDGFELITRIRREATLRGLPIIVLSSRTSQAARDRALAAGANVFLPKSRHRRSLVAAVTACLQQREDNEPQVGEDEQR